MTFAPITEKLNRLLMVEPMKALVGFKAFSLVMVFLMVGGCLYHSSAHPKGDVRRMASGYVANINARQKAMFKPQRGEQIGWIQLLVVSALLILYGFFPLPGFLVAALVAIVAPPQYVKQQAVSRRKKIDIQSPTFCLALSSSLKATASIGDAFRNATDVTDAPLHSELRLVLQQVGLGSTLEEALLALSSRVQSVPLDVVVSALLIGRQTGGDLPRILEGTSASLRELQRLDEFTDKTTRQGKQAAAVGALMPILLVFGLTSLMPGFLDPLVQTTKGQVGAAQIAAVYVFALFLTYRITRKSI